MDVEKDLLATFFEHQVVMKMFHFQTKRYGAHKAADAYAATFAENFDRFMEVAQGELGEMRTVPRLEMSAELVEDGTVVEHLDGFVGFLRGLKFGNHDLSPELDGIRGDMIKEVQKLKYVLRFE